MPAQLLATKLSMPPRPNRWVPRPRLDQKLGEDLYQGGGFTRRLTLICAPAGYGKTSLTCAWLHENKKPAAWLTLDDSDNDPALFDAYLVAAIQRIHPGFGEGLRGMMAAPTGVPPQALMTALLNELAALPGLLILALDDYHNIHTPAIHQRLAFLLDHQPVNLHLLILTREDPLLPLARLRAAGLAAEVRQDDLRFTTAEAAAFFRAVMHVPLTTADIEALERRTEGWAAGLQLAALSLQGRGNAREFIQDFTGSSRYILDYLIEEVFDRQSTPVQDFLLKTSILETLSAPLCAAVSFSGGSAVIGGDTPHPEAAAGDVAASSAYCQQLLRTLEQANLFIVPLDQRGEWYRYHHLFAELLRYRLRVQTGISETRLHLNASRWYEAQGFLPEAIHHALRGKDWERAAALILQACDTRFRSGEIATLLTWFGQLPPEIVRSNPRYVLSYAWVLLLSSQFDHAAQLLAIAEGLAPEGSIFSGMVATACAYLARSRGEHASVIALSQKALALLPETQVADRANLAMNLGIAFWHEGRLTETEQTLRPSVETARASGNRFAELTDLLFLARVHASRGELRRSEPLFAQIAEVGRQVPIAALAQYDLSTLYLEWDRLPEAMERLQLGLEISERSGNIEFLSSGYLQLALLELVNGDIPAALQAAERSYALVRGFTPAQRARSEACLMQVALAQGDLPSAERWYAQMEADLDAHSFYRFLSLNQPRLLLARGEVEAAQQLLETACQTAERAGWGYGLVAARVLLVLAAPDSGTGQDALEAALRIAQPEGYLRTFATAGIDLVPFLRTAAESGIHTEYASRILTLLAPSTPKPHPPAPPLVEPLSARELEVLRLAALGCTNQQIADRLVISLGTAKTHIHSIIGKLGVSNRTQAIAKARELDLL